MHPKMPFCQFKVIRPILEYASPVWCLHISKDISQLESIQQCTACWLSLSIPSSTINPYGC